MMNVDVETKILLDKLYNLRSKDSVILSRMKDEKDIAEQTKNRTAEEKLDLAAKVKELSDEEVLLAKEGQLLKEALKNINKASFGVVFNKLNIDFDPKMLSEKVEAVLPSTIDEIKKDILTTNEKLDSVVKEMNDAITTIDELGIRKDEAFSNQSKLNEYFELALAGNINITRDALTNLLSKFDLSVGEQRESAKLLMFPEDGLYEYDEKINNKKSKKSFSDVFADAKQKEPVVAPVQIVEPIISPIKLEEPVIQVDEPVIKLETEDIHPIKLEEAIFEPINLEIKEEPIIAPVVFEPVTFEPVAPVQEIKPIIIDTPSNNEEEMFKTLLSEPVIFDPVGLKSDDVKVSEVVKVNEKVNVSELLTSVGFKVSDFSMGDVAFIEENINKEVFEKNVKLVKDLGLNSDIFNENVELFIDSELDEKLNTLINVGKVPFDIYLNPNVLVKYDVNELKKSINSLKESGLDPKKVPLMAF